MQASIQEKLKEHFVSGRQSELKDKAWKRFTDIGLPSKKDEEWKYNSLAAFKSSLLRKASENETHNLPGPLVKAQQIQILNGKVQTNLLNIRGLKASLISDEEFMVLRREVKLNKQEGLRSFSELNTALNGEVLLLEVEKGENVAGELEILIGSFSDALSSPRIFIKLNESSSVKIIERYFGGASGAWTNSITEGYLAKKSNLKYTKLEIEHELNHIGLSSFSQEGDSVLDAHCYTWASGFIRNELNTVHLGSNVETHYYGAYISSGKSYVENRTLVDHAQPHCESNEVYKGIALDSSKVVFNGKVIVRQDAQKTNAYQSNKNILLSKTASINAKPQLEIFADDVKCSHGATVGQINKDELFYLVSRGIDQSKAGQILQYAFLAEIPGNIKNEELRNKLESELLEKLNLTAIFK